jgi:hypothetical protein
MTIYLFGLMALWYTTPFTNNISSYWYIPVFILTYAIITQMTISVKMYEDNGTLNPPPSDLWPLRDRTALYILILVLDTIFFHQMYLDGGKTLVRTNSIWNNYIISRFGSIRNFYSFALGWFGVVGLILDFISIKVIAEFNACDFNLPKSWNY